MKIATKWIADSAVDKTKLNADVVGTGITGGAGTALSLDINGLTGETAAATNDYVAIYDASAAAIRKQYRSDFLSWLATPATNQTAIGNITTMQVDVNAVGIGAPLFIASDGNLETADTDDVTKNNVRALALETSTGSKKVLLEGFFRDDSYSWTPGGPLYLSSSAGVLTQTCPTTSPANQYNVGIAVSATVIYFKPFPVRTKYYAESTGESSRSSVTYASKVSLTVPAGIYDLEWSCNVAADFATTEYGLVRVYNTTDSAEYSIGCVDAYTEQYFAQSGFRSNLVFAGEKTIELQYAHGTGSGELMYIANAYISAIKIG